MSLRGIHWHQSEIAGHNTAPFFYCELVMAFPRPVSVSDIQSIAQSQTEWDAVIYISDNSQCSVDVIGTAIAQHASIDARVGKSPLVIPAADVAGQRVIFAPSGDLSRDYDDVRRVYDSAAQAATIAREIGATRPLLLVEINNDDPRYAHALEVAYLGLCQALWQPLEARESLNESDIEPIESVGLLGASADTADWLCAMEAGRRVARDLCGTEPERMAPPRFAQYCEDAFAEGAVSISVESDNALIEKKYPLLHAVGRAAVEVERHQSRVIRLEYEGEGPIEKTLYFAGKGITFDTGGADLKVGGHMAGMSRDKGGAAGVAGFMKAVAMLRPKGIKVVAVLGAVRNSIGANAFVPDEIITGHSGARVRVGNTDAEGRMVLADILSYLREEAKGAVAPELFTVATLTGHAAIAHGPYSALVENGPAKAMDTAHSIAEAGELWADPAHQSLSRREDFDFIRGRTQADDILSSNNAPSVSTARGHQFPMAFLSIAAGLDKHGSDSEQPLPYTHVDIAGSGVENMDWQHGKPTATPVLAFAARYLQGR